MAESDPSDKFIQDFGLDQLECSGEEHSHPTVHHKTVGKKDVVQSSKTEVKDSEFQTFSDVEPQVTEEASQYENAQVATSGATSTMDADNKALELSNVSKVSECKEVNDVITDKELAGRELAQPTAANDYVIQNKNTGNSTDVEPQPTEEASRYENAHVTTTTTDADDEASDINNKSKDTESKRLKKKKKNTANFTDKKDPATSDESDTNKKDPATSDESDTNKKDPATSDESDTIGNAKLAPNPSDVQDYGYWSDRFTTKSLDPAAGIPVVQQQSRICSAGNTIEKQNDKNTRDILEKKTKQSIIECDSKETMARILELINKMITRQLGDLEELEFGQCHLQKEHLIKFLLKNVLNAMVCKISKLSIGYTKNVTDLIPFYCQIAYHYKSTKLSLIFNDLKNEDIKVLFENLYENEEYEEIDMSYNRNIGPVGYEIIGKIVKKHGVRAVILADCDISDDDLHRLFVGMGDAKLEVLDISFSNNVTAKGFAHIGKQVAQKRIKRLKLSDTQLNLETLSAFYEGVKGSIEDSESQQVLIEEIDISYNSAMEPEAYEVLGSMVKLFGVKKLSLAGCGLKKKHLEDFRKKINSENLPGKTKMKSLNAGDNTSIGKGIVEIAKIVKECLLEELDISDCRFSVNELKDFIKALGKAKLERLYLGEERQLGKDYLSQVCNLLPHIKKMLRLKGTVRNSPRKLLQVKLNELRESELEIKLDDDTTLRSEIKKEVPHHIPHDQADDSTEEI